MKIEKQVRTWWIELDPMCDGHSGDAWSERQTSTDIKVIAFEDHQEIVAGLEARINRLREALCKIRNGLTTDQSKVEFYTKKEAFEALKDDEAEK